MKRLICFVMMLMGLTCAAHADGWVEVKPGKGDLTKAQVKEFAVAFFAEKCGVEESVLRQAEWTIQYGHSTVEKPEDAVWSVYTKSIKGHSGAHGMELTGPGELIRWSGHIGEYDKADPGLLDYATPVKPFPTDVQEDTVIGLVREEMVKQGLVKDAAVLTVAPTFAYDEHFNIGFIPVWLVLIEDGQGGRWKAAVSHKGDMLSLVPYEQEFRENRTPNEDFWATTFKGQAYSEEHSLLTGVLECRLSHEEKAEVTARWRPLVEKWIEEHPYYLNFPGEEYEVTCVNIYGVPDEKAIPETEAIKLAGAALTEYLSGDGYLAERNIRTDYFVTDPERPVWRVFLGRPNELDIDTWRALIRKNAEITDYFYITLDARTGEVLQLVNAAAQR